jgi:putative oxidoreductase
MVIQRLFSSFPDSWPGTALLLLRLCVSTAIAFHGMHSGILTGAALCILIAAAWTSAALILIGLWTPIAGGVAAVTEVAEVLTGAPGLLAHIFIIAIAASLVLLGPGAWSIDAYLYGRKRVI